MCLFTGRIAEWNVRNLFASQDSIINIPLYSHAGPKIFQSKCHGTLSVNLIVNYLSNFFKGQAGTRANGFINYVVHCGGIGDVTDDC